MSADRAGYMAIVQGSAESVIAQWVLPRGLVGPLYDSMKTVLGILVVVVLVLAVAYLLRPRIRNARRGSKRDPHDE